MLIFYEVKGDSYCMLLHQSLYIFLADELGRQQGEQQRPSAQMAHVRHVERRQVDDNLALEGFTAAYHIASCPQILIVGVVYRCGGSTLYLDAETSLDQTARTLRGERKAAFAFVAAGWHTYGESA